MKLRSLRIPRPLRGNGLDADCEVFDITIESGKVVAVEGAADQRSRGTVISSPVDAHVHIDKSYTVREVGPANGDLFAAISRMDRHSALWTEAHITTRMEKALHDAWHAGTRALRTHLDWKGAEPPLALAAFEQARHRWQGRLELQFVSLTPLDVFADVNAGRCIAQQVQRSGGVLGAFIYRNDDLVHKLGRVLDLAQEHHLSLDFHVDEGLDADATGLRTIAQLVIERGGLPGLRVVCGHACSLSMQAAEEANETLRLCVLAGIHLIALPTTNLYLQGAWSATPLERGITRVREAQAIGLRPVLATDNVQDAFYPYGSYDLMQTFGLGVQMAHLAPAQDWLGAITTHAAAALGLAWDGLIAPDCPADLLVLDAADEFELLDVRGHARTVVRAGRILERR
ncbi:amidohydrolase family protein [Variovorax dokdonensis]|uniref:Amidohydrolase family protein n=1 Tax=Variovorax dokdonensis TaxID=344883 RepID=A0ABT7NEA4_9BURK|nr:amidohydrolase family protein [Variovorax dokdonensis]MDM0046195.1 amidohydrolase family protein [Variovorax dokdonensis]